MSEEKRPVGRPKSSTTSSEQELLKCQDQFDMFDESVKSMTMDRLSKAPVEEKEPAIKLSNKQIQDSKDVYLKPIRTYPPGAHPKTGEREKFNEKFRDEYEFAKEYVHFIAHHNEIIGEAIEFHIKKFPGTSIEEWRVPTGIPVWAPRMVAERIKESRYHRLKMVETQSRGADGMGQYYGSMAADSTIQRLDAVPVSTRKSLFMGAM